MLLLTGPTGVGKTATIRSLAAELRCEVQEWTNPVLDAFNPSQTFLSDNRGQQYYYYVVPGSIIFRCTDSLTLKTMFCLNPGFYFCTMRTHVLLFCEHRFRSGRYVLIRVTIDPVPRIPSPSQQVSYTTDLSATSAAAEANLG